MYFGYDGTEKTFKDIKFVPSVAKIWNYESC